MIQVVACPHPLRADRHIFEAQPGASVEDLVVEAAERGNVTLRLLGFQAVQMRVDRVLAESERQLVFARSIPLAHRVEPVDLYAREAEPCS